MLRSDSNAFIKDAQAQVDFCLMSVRVQFVVSFISQVVELKS
jgi:hypothetical protein